MKRLLLTTAFLWTTLGLLLGCAGIRDHSAGKAAKNKVRDQDQLVAYEKLIAMYPEDNQGIGKEVAFPTVEQQPMTYGLILTAESLRYKATHGEESKRRIRKAAQWVLDNQDLDNDGKPGWGLPQAWDAFQDGTTNPINQPYTITTAIVLNGLLESAMIDGLWTAPELDEIRTVMTKVAVRWCSEIWSEGYGGGYFWYSPGKADDIFAVNSPSLFTGNLARLLSEHPDAFTPRERDLVQSRVDDMARAIVATADLREDLPFWNYMPNSRNKRPNDLIHHIYTILGIEMYRDYHGRIRIPWTRKQAISSVDQFWKAGQIMEYPQDVTYSDGLKSFNEARAVQWSAGSMVAAYAQWGEFEKARKALEAIQRDYGSWPLLQLYPGGTSDVFYPRYSAHVLWGQSLYEF